MTFFFKNFRHSIVFGHILHDPQFSFHPPCNLSSTSPVISASYSTLKLADIGLIVPHFSSPFHYHPNFFSDKFGKLLNFQNNKLRIQSPFQPLPQGNLFSFREFSSGRILKQRSDFLNQGVGPSPKQTPQEKQSTQTQKKSKKFKKFKKFKNLNTTIIRKSWNRESSLNSDYFESSTLNTKMNQLSETEQIATYPVQENDEQSHQKLNLQPSTRKRLEREKTRRKLPPIEEDKWYHKNKDLLRFSCTQCGECCTGAPGVVYVTVRDITRMARRLNMKVADFCAEHVRVVMNANNRMFYSLKEVKRNGKYDCIFLEKGKCKVYLERPAQCWTYPFWSNVVESEESWKAEMEYCDGIGRGEPVDPSEIDRLVHIDTIGREQAEYFNDDIEDISKYFEEELDSEEEQESKRIKLRKEVEKPLLNEEELEAQDREVESVLANQFKQGLKIDSDTNKTKVKY